MEHGSRTIQDGHSAAEASGHGGSVERSQSAATKKDAQGTPNGGLAVTAGGTGWGSEAEAIQRRLSDELWAMRMRCLGAEERARLAEKALTQYQAAGSAHASAGEGAVGRRGLEAKVAILEGALEESKAKNAALGRALEEAASRAEKAEAEAQRLGRTVSSLEGQLKTAEEELRKTGRRQPPTETEAELAKVRSELGRKEVLLTKKGIDLAEALSQLDAALPTLAECQQLADASMGQVLTQKEEISRLKMHLVAAEDRAQLAEGERGAGGSETVGRAPGERMGSLQMKMENAGRAAEKLEEAGQEAHSTSTQVHEVRKEVQRLKAALEEAQGEARWHEERAMELAEQLVLQRVHAAGRGERALLTDAEPGWGEEGQEQRQKEAFQILMDEIELLREQAGGLVERLEAAEAELADVKRWNAELAKGHKSQPGGMDGVRPVPMATALADTSARTADEDSGEASARLEENGKLTEEPVLPQMQFMSDEEQVEVRVALTKAEARVRGLEQSLAEARRLGKVAVSEARAALAREAEAVTARQLAEEQQLKVNEMAVLKEQLAQASPVGPTADLAAQIEMNRKLSEQVHLMRAKLVAASERLRLAEAAAAMGSLQREITAATEKERLTQVEVAQKEAELSVTAVELRTRDSQIMAEKGSAAAVGLHEYQAAVLERDEAQRQVAALEREIQAKEIRLENLAGELKAAQEREEAAIQEKVGVVRELMEAKGKVEVREAEAKGGTAAGLAVMRKQQKAALQREREEAKRQLERARERHQAREAELAAVIKGMEEAKAALAGADKGVASQLELMDRQKKDLEEQLEAASRVAAEAQEKLETKEKEVVKLTAELAEKNKTSGEHGQSAASTLIAVAERLKAEVAELRESHQIRVQEGQVLQETVERQEPRAEDDAAEEERVGPEASALQRAKRELEQRVRERVEEQVRVRVDGILAGVAKEKEEAVAEERERGRAAMSALEEEVEELKRASEQWDAETRQLGRKYEEAVKELQQRESDSSSHEEKAQQLATVVREKAAMEERLRGLESNLKKVAKELAAVTRQKESASRRAKEELHHLELELAKAREELVEARKEVGKVSEEAKKTAEALLAEAKAREAAVGERAALEARAEALAKEREEARAAVKGLEAELKLVGASDGKWAQEAAALREQLERAVEEGQKAEERARGLEDALGVAEQRSAAEEAEHVRRVGHKEGEIQALAAQLEHFQRAEQAKDAELRKLAEVAAQEESQLARISGELERLLAERRHWEVAGGGRDRQRPAHQLEALSASPEAAKRAEVSARRAKDGQEVEGPGAQAQESEHEAKKLRSRLPLSLRARPPRGGGPDLLRRASLGSAPSSSATRRAAARRMPSAAASAECAIDVSGLQSRGPANGRSQ